MLTQNPLKRIFIWKHYGRYFNDDLKHILTTKTKQIWIGKHYGRYSNNYSMIILKTFLLKKTLKVIWIVKIEIWILGFEKTVLGLDIIDIPQFLFKFSSFNLWVSKWSSSQSNVTSRNCLYFEYCGGPFIYKCNTKFIINFSEWLLIKNWTFSSLSGYLCVKGREVKSNYEVKS